MTIKIKVEKDGRYLITNSFMGGSSCFYIDDLFRNLEQLLKEEGAVIRKGEVLRK